LSQGLGQNTKQQGCLAAVFPDTRGGEAALTRRHRDDAIRAETSREAVNAA
jgi:hypothetical protein